MPYVPASGHQRDLPPSLNAQDRNHPSLSGLQLCNSRKLPRLITHGTGSALQRILELGLDAFELAVEDLALLPVTGVDTLNNLSDFCVKSEDRLSLLYLSR